MDKKALLLFGVGFLILPIAVLAEIQTYGPVYSINDVVAAVVGVAWIISAAAAVILFMYAGLMFLMARGDPENIKKARYAVLWGVVGVIVMILAFSIHLIVETSLTTGL